MENERNGEEDRFVYLFSQSVKDGCSSQFNALMIIILIRHTIRMQSIYHCANHACNICIWWHKANLLLAWIIPELSVIGMLLVSPCQCAVALSVSLSIIPRICFDNFRIQLIFIALLHPQVDWQHRLAVLFVRLLNASKWFCMFSFTLAVNTSPNFTKRHGWPFISDLPMHPCPTPHVGKPQPQP